MIHSCMLVLSRHVADVHRVGNDDPVVPELVELVDSAVEAELSDGIEIREYEAGVRPLLLELRAGTEVDVVVLPSGSHKGGALGGHAVGNLSSGHGR